MGVLFIFALIAIAVFAGGFWLGTLSFENPASKIIAGILCGLGAVAIVGGIAFAGCMFLVQQTGFH